MEAALHRARRPELPNSRHVVIDTNVILFDAQAIFKFKDADVYIPISVIE
jgi:predicted ribonuclease YlaK